MRKIILALATISLTATPAIARDHHRYRGHDSHRNSGNVAAGVLLGGIIGYAIANSGKDNDYKPFNKPPTIEEEFEQNRRYFRQNYPQYADERFCWTKRWKDSYNNGYSRTFCEP